MRMKWATVAVVASVLLGACGGDGTDVTGSGTTTTTEEATTTTAAATTTTPGDLPGERAEVYPYADAQLAVVGVQAGDTLNVRAGPETSYDVVVELEPLETDITATGHNRHVGDAFWAEIRAEGETGWANVRFLAHPGQVNDITNEIGASPSDRPSADSIEELGRAVGERRASEEPPSRIVIVDGPHHGDVPEITVDVLGVGDDAVMGERLHVFADVSGSGSNRRYTVRSVEATTLCSRAVDDGLCV